MPTNIEFTIAAIGAACMLAACVLMIPAAIISLFKIIEADRYFGVGRLGGERLALKGLPFSLGRMAQYGLVLMFSNTSFIQKRYATELEKIAASSPPKNLTRLLIWLYGTWFLLGVATFLFGSLLLAMS
ncbi:hypothetical protein [Billgrantia kenyensis]|uniref:Uncharacterized protein n=1 Tax=Billgrantia kenyensis TaxID=321266 RepID=A0A7V9W0T1_9GAMM|nr:hypothetical protein [Halomonas kenyensis]MBA2778968.1 hypothetical protein [Halomonas kenyensis]MCG6662895.1 hypothetical protein [Halomonas kenyensis]